MSIVSNTLSITSSGCSLKTEIHQIETYRDILLDQIDSLQKFFDAVQNGQHSIELENGLKSVEFKAEVRFFN